MYSLFNPQNWSELFHEEGFARIAVAVTVILSASAALLFSDTLQRWRAEAQERAKWLYWKRQ